MSETENVAHLINEYSDVQVSIDRSFASPRLVVLSVQTGQSVSLDATALEAIAALDETAVTRLVAAFSETGSSADAVKDL